MATGDVTISVAVAGGVTKTVTLDNATRALARTYLVRLDPDIDTDTKWAVSTVNKLGSEILAQANKQAESTASWTAKTFTAAS